MSLPSFALRHRAIVVAGTMILVVWGTYAFWTMPRREDPEYTIRTCVISTLWPGATALKVEQLVTKPIEDAVAELDEVDKVRSTTVAGYSSVYVDLEETTSSAGVDNAWDKVRAKVDLVRSKLPDGTRGPVVNTNFGDTAAMILALYQTPLPGKQEIERPYTPRELEIIAERLEDDIKLVDAVALTELYGVQDEVIYLEADAGTWSQIELTTDRLRTLLAARNIVAPGGSIDTPLGRFTVKPTGEFGAVGQVERVIVDAPEAAVRGEGRAYGAPVYLKDLDITVRRDYVDPPRTITRYGARDAAQPEARRSLSAPCVVLSLTMKHGHNIVTLGKSVRETIARAKASVLPRDIEVAIVSDQPRTVDSKVKDFTANLWQAVAIVVGVAFLLVGLRLAIVMATAIPMVILAAIGLSTLFGVQLEQVSIAALIIALGMLVDCAIEVGDNAHRFLGEGHSRLDAAVLGSEQISFPVLIATLTTVAAFLPMAGIPGVEGEYLFSLPVVVSLALMMSWVLAMTMTTVMAYWIMRSASHASPLALIAGVVGKVVGRKKGSGSVLGAIYGGACRLTVRLRWLTTAAAAGALAWALSLVVTGKIGMQYFPPAFRNQFVIDIFLPEGASIRQTDSVCRRVEDIVRRLSAAEQEGKPIERLVNMATTVGQGGPRFYLNLNPEQPAANYAQILVNTCDPTVVRQYVQEIRREADATVPGARVAPRMLDMGPPVDSPVGIRVVGEDMATLHRVAGRLKDVLRAIDGTLDVHDTWGSFGYQLAVEVDEAQANLSGVTNASVAQTLNAYFSGHPLTTYREGDHSVPIMLRLPSAARGSLDQVRATYVEGLFGKVPLDALARVETRWQPAKILRHKQGRAIEVRCRVREGLLPSNVLDAAMRRVREIERSLPPGFRIEITGEQEQIHKVLGKVTRAFMVSFLLIVLCLIVQYNSLVKPLIILVTLPMAAIGALAGLYLTGRPLSFMAQLGLLSLAGIVLNDAIVLIEFTETLIREKLAKGEGLAAPGEKSCSGLTRDAFRECIVRGGRMRLLPICLTTLTTVGGLLPLALLGGPMWEPMAIVIISGLLVATLLTLLVLPGIFAIFVETFRVKAVPVEAASRPDLVREAG